MRGLYLDCFSGVSGDMFLGALVDVGVEAAHLKTQVGKLPVGGYRLSTRRVTRGGLSGTKVDVEIDRSPQRERGLRDIARIVEGSRLSAEVRRRAMAAVTTLGGAAARGAPLPRAR